MKLSDQIENIINDMLNTMGGTCQIRRNELASKIGCVPSQINYVIHTRFNEKNGYYVESKRGGGGFVFIKRVNLSKDEYIDRVLLMVEDTLTEQDATILLNNLYINNIINQRELKLIKTATSDKFLPYSQPQRNRMRALLFKNMLVIFY